ncbi:MAG: AAA family ATPase [Kiritimatiellaeota bacterium]|nr:AAA family ATPase [Kiritimatiellota bacterium]
MEQSIEEELEVLIRARYPIINVISWEEERVLQMIHEIAKKRKKRVKTWSYNTGLVPYGITADAQKGTDTSTKDPITALNKVIEEIEPTIYIFKDFHPFLTRTSFSIIRRLREVADFLKNSYKTLILISPSMQIPVDLEKDITVVDFPLPDIQDLNGLLDKIIEDVKDNPQIEINITQEGRERFLRAALGLTLKEAENVFAKTLVIDGKLDADDISVVLSEKQQIIRKSGMLEYYETDESFKTIGGLDALKEWLIKRGKAFSDKARNFGLPPPKGVLFLGVQGCGKSLCAKAVASAWELPLLRFDVGKLFESALGSSEENIRRAIQIAESVSPCVLWMDEIDKAFGGVGGSTGMTDGGTTARIFGSFLTWLSEKKSPVFVIATANDISKLPPELLRKGRLDEIFFVDLPNESERGDIFKIQINKLGRDSEGVDLKFLASQAKGFSGAEIEECVISALYDAFYSDADLNVDHIIDNINATIPLSKTMGEKIAELRSWSEGRARPASYTNETADDMRNERKLEL